MQRFWSELFKDVDGNFSSKRFILLASFAQFIFYFNMNMFTGRTADVHLVDLLATIIYTGLGVITAEAIAKRVQKKHEDNTSLTNKSAS